MSYINRFRSTDALIPHLDTFVPSIQDQILKSRYVGLLAIAGVSVYELAIKDIFYDFSDRKHAALGAAARSNFNRLNGRIKIQALKNEHTIFFGEKYKKRFEKKLKDREHTYLLSQRQNIVTSYSNLIVWRHGFAHESIIPATYDEVKNAYTHGKEVVHCLHEVMTR